uniref:Peptide-O-fucosyltransferase 1 n=1 Tax=Haptolina brevifila TaxID=156173 RepID=A0A7S2G7J0_9EUKA|mmetsp:Transcript_28945/g.58275  ORF Transcript_28945/g.58275 Transcript_28945/m.58275 type:complete len:399 (+) Transcript_28945:497-1693(+)|eukprot:CAMPEP_0174733082 /NCGR_PEP_ID=MMETSP1094-20130205/60627_1 /TAXON_ID=156173 /ORGANISM="Chrysochromulina brevifilum, Strain UTEX LB 985" /LENGTH=398 /DNA_ID=CAMNT_0015935697 /DNA_START=495 /DNA_END=1691 /DNA_ORIENTATION=+
MSDDDLQRRLLPLGANAALPQLLQHLSSGGRPAVLQVLKDAGVKLAERQTLATAVARHARGDQASSSPLLAQPLAEPLAVTAEGGLCNKLRCILSYREIAQDAGRHLVVVWSLGSFCDTHFDALFEPIEGITVLPSNDGHKALEETLLSMGMAPSAVPGDFGCHPAIESSEREIQMWKHLRPLPAIAAAIEETVAGCGPRFVAAHIRRTDFLTLFGVKTGDAAFEHFYSQHLRTEGTTAYLATDNAATQRHFQKICGERYRAQASICEEPRRLRHTSVAEAVVDIFACVAAQAFIGTAGSSFSDAIWSIRRMRGVAAQDHHGFDRPRDARPRPQAVETSGLLLALPLGQQLLRLLHLHGQSINQSISMVHHGQGEQRGNGGRGDYGGVKGSGVKLAKQ